MYKNLYNFQRIALYGMVGKTWRIANRFVLYKMVNDLMIVDLILL